MLNSKFVMSRLGSYYFLLKVVCHSAQKYAVCGQKNSYSTMKHKASVDKCGTNVMDFLHSIIYLFKIGNQ